MTNFKHCNRCATDCEHCGAIRLCVCGKYTNPTITRYELLHDMTLEQTKDFLTDFAISVLLESAPTNIGAWLTEKVDVLHQKE